MFTSQEAKLRYLSGDYEILKHGAYVLCAVTGEKIPLEELKYWSFERQEAYKDCQASYERECAMQPHLRKLMGSTLEK